MDPLRLHTLKFIIEFFRDVVAKESENKMTCYNIVVTTCHTIFRPKVMQPDDMDKQFIYKDAMLKMMEYHDVIFDPNVYSLVNHQDDGLLYGQVGTYDVDEQQLPNFEKLVNDIYTIKPSAEEDDSLDLLL